MHSLFIIYVFHELLGDPSALPSVSAVSSSCLLCLCSTKLNATQQLLEGFLNKWTMVSSHLWLGFSSITWQLLLQCQVSSPDVHRVSTSVLSHKSHSCGQKAGNARQLLTGMCHRGTDSLSTGDRAKHLWEHMLHTQGKVRNRKAGVGRAHGRGSMDKSVWPRN